MTTNNHPAHSPLTSHRLHQMRGILSKASAQRDGGDIGYAMSDAVKLIDEVLAGYGREPVLYAAEETLAYAKMGELHLKCLSQPMGDAVIPLYRNAQSAPVSVPDELTREEYRLRFMMEDNFNDTYRGGWNACRAAMLQGKPEPVSDPYKLPATLIKAMQSAIDQLDRRAGKVECGYPQHSHSVSGVWDQSNGRIANEPCSVCALWDEMREYLSAAPQQEVKR